MIYRVFDLLISCVVLVLLLPLLAAIAVAVKLSSAGPILFRQARVGKDERLFELLKFRSMRVAGDGPLVTQAADSRITPIGRWLRKCKLDELPQLWNVIRGEMSLVGPRPEVPRYVAHYTEQQKEVLTVRPGITGISQLVFRNEETLLAGREDVEGFYIASVMPAKLELDLKYVRQRTFWLNMSLLVKTALRIVLPEKCNEQAAEQV